MSRHTEARHAISISPRAPGCLPGIGGWLVVPRLGRQPLPVWGGFFVGQVSLVRRLSSVIAQSRPAVRWPKAAVGESQLREEVMDHVIG